MNRTDNHFEAAADRAFAANQAVDRFYAEQTEDEVHLINVQLAKGDAAAIQTIADEFQGAATTVPAIVAAWARKDSAEVLRLVDEAMRTAVQDVAAFRAEQINP
ncbi:hypothetical protein [Cupriavidus sp. DL-D2]|uniref:hypothetical protein n=1 Tax=Cupriavidus sp. DL-D2 TaxID=3144974 RepID=UPI0032125D28